LPNTKGYRKDFILQASYPNGKKGLDLKGVFAAKTPKGYAAVVDSYHGNRKGGGAEKRKNGMFIM